MFGVDETGKMRRAHFREGRSIKEISRDLGALRAPVRKVLRSGATEFVCEHGLQPTAAQNWPFRSVGTERSRPSVI